MGTGRAGLQEDLDFIVIGAQKGGTTSLWEYLRQHPTIAMPDYKEAPVFCAQPEAIPGHLAAFIRENFDGLVPEVRRGKVATHYMMGLGSANVEQIADQMSRNLPGVHLIALLRDPIERAMSHYRMSVRRGWEVRSFDAAVEELFEPRNLNEGRTLPTETNSYLVQGEYGRILRIYESRFPRAHIQVESTIEMCRSPGSVIDRILVSLGLPPGFRPEGLDVHHHRGGVRPRVDVEAERQLHAFLEKSLWPTLGDRAEHARRTFDFFWQTWNVVPDDSRPVLSDSNRRRLEDHYRADAVLLADLEVESPWLDGWAETYN